MYKITLVFTTRMEFRKNDVERLILGLQPLLIPLVSSRYEIEKVDDPLAADDDDEPF